MSHNVLVERTASPERPSVGSVLPTRICTSCSPPAQQRRSLEDGLGVGDIVPNWGDRALLNAASSSPTSSRVTIVMEWIVSLAPRSRYSQGRSSEPSVLEQ